MNFYHEPFIWYMPAGETKHNRPNYSYKPERIFQPLRLGRFSIQVDPELDDDWWIIVPAWMRVV